MNEKVLLIDLDDVGRELISRAAGLGFAPNLAGFMASGRNYPNFWAAPMCSPFRARALTGQEAHRVGNLVGRIVTPNDSFAGPLGTWLPWGLPGSKVKIGKWHLSSGPNFAMGVVAGGYDKFVGLMGNLSSAGGSYYNYEEWVATSSGAVSSMQSQHHTSRMAGLVLDEIAWGTDLIHASFQAIHQPLENPPDNEPPGHLYSGTTEQRLRLNMLFHLDYWLGQIVPIATAAGYVVIIACDNGTDGDGKGTYLEDGSNTNLIVLGQNVIPGESQRLVQATDLWRTVRRLRGDPASLIAVDSIDFTDDFLNVPALDLGRQFMRVDWFPFLGSSPPANKWSRMIRDQRWKYVDQKLKPGSTLASPFKGLFDLLSDPEEQVNLLDNPLSPEAQAAYDLLLANLP